MARKKKQSKTKATKSEFRYGKPTKDSYDLIIKPILSEQSQKLMETQNKITVRVKKDANKVAIKNAFESIFGVKVKKVNTSFVRPRTKTVGKYKGETASYKKAIITLQEGQALDLLKE